MMRGQREKKEKKGEMVDGRGIIYFSRWGARR